MTMFATIRLQFEHIHCWPGAPEPVEFLSHPHRHMFHVTVRVEQFHNQRDIEYLMFKTWLQDRIEESKSNWPNSSSCEAMAQIIAGYIDYYVNPILQPARRIAVEVSEDGENGALCISDPL